MGYRNYEQFHKERRKNHMAMIYDADKEQVREETEDPRAMLRPAEVADLLDLHVNTVYRLFRNQIVPAFKLGGSWRIYKKDLIGFIEKHSG